MLRIAVTGISGDIGSRLLPALEKRDDVEQIVGIDLRPPRRRLSDRTVFYRMSVGNPLLGDLFKAHNINALIHLAFSIRIGHSREFLHEINVIDPINLFRACITAGVFKIVMLSSAEVYGYRPNNPFYIDESAPLRPTPHDPYIQDKAELDEYCREVLTRYPDMAITILRPSFCTGPGMQSRLTHLLYGSSLRMLPAGYNPLYQFIHVDDLVRAITYSLIIDARGVFNIAGNGIVSLAEVIKMARGFSFRLPGPVLHHLTNAKWYLRMTPIPAAMMRLLKYSLVVSTEKAAEDLVFYPRFTSKEAFETYAAEKKLSVYRKKPERERYLSARSIIRDYSRTIEEDEIQKARHVIHEAGITGDEMAGEGSPPEREAAILEAALDGEDK